MKLTGDYAETVKHIFCKVIQKECGLGNLQESKLIIVHELAHHSTFFLPWSRLR